MTLRRAIRARLAPGPERSMRLLACSYAGGKAQGTAQDVMYLAPSMDPALEIEDETTWQAEFRARAAAGRQVLISYQRERRRVAVLGQEAAAKIKTPRNALLSEYDRLVETLEGILASHRIVGYHCTRLTPGEATDIRVSGLRVLSLELVRVKLVHCFADGHLTQANYAYLQNSPHIADSLRDQFGRRTHQIAYCPNQSTLRSAGHVYRFLQSWGGEVAYGGHEDDSRIGPVLRRIGVPYIIKCAVPCADVKESCRPLAERLLAQFVSGEVKDPEPSAAFDLVATRDLAPGNVLDLIAGDDPQFSTLTNYKNWDARDRPYIPLVTAAT